VDDVLALEVELASKLKQKTSEAITNANNVQYSTLLRERVL
jgi:hypothetical protein